VRRAVGIATAAALLVASGGAASAATAITAAGDIACPAAPCQANRQTARLVRRVSPAAALTLGDNQYDVGALSSFMTSYRRTWGAFKPITRPVPGNHDYETPGAAGYYGYFGHQARPAHGGYYSYDVGDWHLVALNSEVRSPAQTRWLRRDLRRDHHRCELAYWHEPRWSSGVVHGGTTAVAGWWRILFRAGVDVVLNGHEHNYERFAPMSPGGRKSRRGIREFVVGTGGESLYGLGPAVHGSERRIVAYGILAMALRPASYGWRFLRTSGGVGDHGTARCHR
jgi:hypothetical protein